MRRYVLSFALAAVVVLSAAVAMAGNSAVILLTPSQMKWESSPLLPPGGKQVVLAGDPSKPGLYALRALFPNGSASPVHYHGGAEYLTIIKGTLLIGFGDKPDRSKMKAFPPGSFLMIPAGVHHYVISQGDVIVDATGMGPFTMTAIKGGHM